MIDLGGAGGCTAVNCTLPVAIRSTCCCAVTWSALTFVATHSHWSQSPGPHHHWQWQLSQSGERVIIRVKLVYILACGIQAYHAPSEYFKIGTCSCECVICIYTIISPVWNCRPTRVLLLIAPWLWQLLLLCDCRAGNLREFLCRPMRNFVACCNCE